MLSTGFIEDDGIFTAERLGRSYRRWLIAYLLGMGLLWTLGVEAIYSHPTPFYGYARPVFRNALDVLAAVAVVWGSYRLVRFAVFPSEHRVASMLARVRDVLIVAFFGVLFIAALYRAVRTGEGTWIQTLVHESVSLRWHGLATLVFASSFGLFFLLLPSLDWQTSHPNERATRWALVGVVVFAALFPASIAMLRGGVDALADPYTRQNHEYIGDIGKGVTIHGLFHDYIKMHPYLSMHAKVHPPGPIAFLWILSFLAGREPLGLAVATILFGSLSVVPLCYWVKDMLGARTAITACAMYSVVPSIVLFTATSADILFMPFTLTTLLCFWRAVHRNSFLYALAAGVGYALCSLLSFSLMSLGAFFAFVGLWRMLEQRYRLAVIKTAVIMVCAFVAVHGSVRLWSGFDVIACFQACKMQFDFDQLNLDDLAPRYPSWTFRFLNPLCWVYFAGIPVSVLFLRQVLRPEQGQRALSLVFILTLLAMDMLYLARGEGERSAMYVFPMMVIPGAMALDRITTSTRSVAPLAVTLAFLGFQCWLTESYFYTYW